VSLYRLIDEESQRQPVSRLSRTLGVTRSGFDDWQRQPLSDRALADWLLTEQIRGIFEESEQSYGSPRVFKELKLGRGMQIGEKRVARLMRQVAWYSESGLCSRRSLPLALPLVLGWTGLLGTDTAVGLATLVASTTRASSW
jgi:HTH-like domain